MDGDRPEDVDTMVEPDISIICDRRKIDKHGCKGAPDMVVEIKVFLLKRKLLTVLACALAAAAIFCAVHYPAAVRLFREGVRHSWRQDKSECSGGLCDRPVGTLS